MDTFRTFSATRDVFAHLACHPHLVASEQTVVDARFWPTCVPEAGDLAGDPSHAVEQLLCTAYPPVDSGGRAAGPDP